MFFRIAYSLVVKKVYIYNLGLLECYIFVSGGFKSFLNYKEVSFSIYHGQGKEAF